MTSQEDVMTVEMKPLDDMAQCTNVNYYNLIYHLTNFELDLYQYQRTSDSNATCWNRPFDIELIFAVRGRGKGLFLSLFV